MSRSARWPVTDSASFTSQTIGEPNPHTRSSGTSAGVPSPPVIRPKTPNPASSARHTISSPSDAKESWTAKPQTGCEHHSSMPIIDPCSASSFHRARTPGSSGLRGSIEFQSRGCAGGTGTSGWRPVVGVDHGHAGVRSERTRDDHQTHATTRFPGIAAQSRCPAGGAVRRHCARSSCRGWRLQQRFVHARCLGSVVG